MNPMFEATATDFPFVAEMPKREKSKWRKVLDAFQEIQAITKVEGTLIPQVFAAQVLDLSTARIAQLCNEGRLRVVQVGKSRFVTERSVVDWAKAEHKTGRPLKYLDGVLAGTETETQAALRAVRDATEARRQAKESQK
jgi:hypothetical protein